MKQVVGSIRGVALWYIVLSIFIGLALVFLVPEFSPGPTGDCYDSAWSAIPAARDIKQRAAIINHYDHITQIGSGIMLAIGFIVFARLLFLKGLRDRHISQSLVAGVLFIMLCYGLTIWVLSGPVCGSNLG